MNMLAKQIVQFIPFVREGRDFTLNADKTDIATWTPRVHVPRPTLAELTAFAKTLALRNAFDAFWKTLTAQQQATLLDWKSTVQDTIPKDPEASAINIKAQAFAGITFTAPQQTAKTTLIAACEALT